uniref:Apyrase n=2 Tax=Tabanus yao TaxID=485572 RepID=APY_TABYA|nr:RecName: Full=Apyrase; AltName: Full=ATP-diphosphatase; Short=ADPase; AltName: Full=ATP-diphosphohydrolase; AltName: Full=Adenosine diphosphatase; AltName: Allergen=Tab y 1; Flags: Precursor [Tabanus yao]ADX78255.1 Tab y 3 allergen [Tabanus yao]
MFKITVFIYVLQLILPSKVHSSPVPDSDNGLREFPLSIVHINDFHARFEQTDELGGQCKPTAKCVGGYARLVTTVKKLKEEGQNTIFLNAADNYQGTLWYNLGKWNVTAYFMNLLPADAMTLGNHEFDDKIEGIVPFLEVIKTPIVVANIDDSLEPTFKGKYTKSVVLERGGRKIGIVGVIAQNTDNISSPGKLRFLDEIQSVKNESKRLREEEKVDIVIVLSHIGLDHDYDLAEQAGDYIDAIIGGHSHSFLWTGDNPPGKEKVVDAYPVEIVQTSGKKVLIVQASAFARYVGNITLYFGENNNLIRYAGAPVYLDSDVPEVPQIVEEMKAWEEFVHEKGNEIIAESRVVLSRENCRVSDCNIGNFFTDAYVHEYVTSHTGPYWTPVSVGLMNVGGIRASVDRGNITFSQLITMAPFENTVDTFDLSGKHLLEAFEHAVTVPNRLGFNGQNMLQVSGVKLVYDVTKCEGQRVVSAKIRCQKCDIPKYEPLDPEETYRIVTASFLANGGDGFTMIRDNKKNYKVGRKDYDVLINYAKYSSPITIGEEGRIRIIQ